MVCITRKFDDVLKYMERKIEIKGLSLYKGLYVFEVEEVHEVIR